MRNGVADLHQVSSNCRETNDVRRGLRSLSHVFQIDVDVRKPATYEGAIRPRLRTMVMSLVWGYTMPIVSLLEAIALRQCGTDRAGDKHARA